MRESFEEIIKFFEHQLPKLDVEMILNTEATIEKMLAERADAVIVATRATPYVPDIPGAQGANVITSNDVLTGARTGEHVVIIDTQGTPPGYVVAEVLADQASGWRSSPASTGWAATSQAPCGTIYTSGCLARGLS